MLTKQRLLEDNWDTATEKTFQPFISQINKLFKTSCNAEEYTEITSALTHSPQLQSCQLTCRTILALGKIKCWHFPPFFSQLSQKQQQELLFRNQIRLLCLVTLLPQILAMSTFSRHFVKGFGSHQSEQCEYTTHCLCVYYAQHQERKRQTGENCARMVTNGHF